MKKSISCCLSHQNPHIYLFKAGFSCKRCWICADFSPDSDQITFSLEKTVLWIDDLYFSNGLKLKTDLFLENTQLFTSHDVNWWTGVVWIIVMFLSAVWTLILTAPIHCRGSIAEQVMECYISPNLMKKQTHLHLRWPEDEEIFITFSFVGELFL